MFLEDDFVLLSKESIKKYGATGATILQITYSVYGPRIPLEVDEWCSPGGILDFIQPEIVKRTLTGLDKNGLITIEDTVIVLSEHKKESKEETIFDKKKEKTNRKASPAWEMAIAIIQVCKDNPQLTSPKRYLKFASSLIELGYTKEDILKWYGHGGWWYKNQYKGEMGNPPNQYNISKTIEMAKKGVKKQEPKKTSTKDNFFR